MSNQNTNGTNTNGVLIVNTNEVKTRNPNRMRVSCSTVY